MAQARPCIFHLVFPSGYLRRYPTVARSGVCCSFSQRFRMKVVDTPQEMRELAEALRRDRAPLGLVPTMGALHEGHGSLIARAMDECSAVVVSIFVNPAQFSTGEDYNTYPRTFEADLQVCREMGVCSVYAPKADSMYPGGYDTWVDVPGLGASLCGGHRAGHFQGVATVVLKLFSACLPHRAYFGEKDYQQLVLIERMAHDLNIGVEIIPCPIVREDDGMALSSRNAYLSDEERLRARSISRALFHAKKMVASGERLCSTIIKACMDELEKAGSKVDYVEIVDPATLEKVEKINGAARMAIAAHIGETRLIDNISLEPEDEA